MVIVFTDSKTVDYGTYKDKYVYLYVQTYTKGGRG